MKFLTSFLSNESLVHRVDWWSIPPTTQTTHDVTVSQSARKATATISDVSDDVIVANVANVSLVNHQPITCQQPTDRQTDGQESSDNRSVEN